MPGTKDRSQRLADAGRFVIDGAFLRTQAIEAVATFLAPFSGLVAATAPTRPRKKRTGA
jgi:hypothetical protein